MICLCLCLESLVYPTHSNVVINMNEMKTKNKIWCKIEIRIFTHNSFVVFVANKNNNNNNLVTLSAFCTSERTIVYRTDRMDPVYKCQFNVDFHIFIFAPNEIYIFNNNILQPHKTIQGARSATAAEPHTEHTILDLFSFFLLSMI